MKVVLFKGHGPVAAAIRWQTRSRYAHAAVLTSDGTLIESKGDTGVHAVAGWHKTDDAELFQVGGFGLTAREENVAVGWLSEQIGKPYDYLMVARFLDREQETRKSSGKWFCSELVFAAYQKAGINLLRDTEPWEVSPGMIARSPLLVPV